MQPNKVGSMDDTVQIADADFTLTPHLLRLKAKKRGNEKLFSVTDAELFKALGKADREKYDRHLEATVGEEVKADRQRRLAEARAGRAASLGDALEVLLEVSDQLPAAQAGWVRRIDHTASEFKVRSAFTPRQAAVIWNIFRQRFPRR